MGEPIAGAHHCLSQQVNLVTEGVIHHAERPPQVRVIQYQENTRQDSIGDLQNVFTLLSFSEICGECTAV